MITPTVSVIVPNYNHAQYLRKRMETILAQTYQNFELILLDDSSKDNSREILSSYANDPRVKLAFNDVTSGSAFKQWNKGVRLARGKYVWIAESDDYADPRFLERLVRVLESDPGIALAYCRSWRVVNEDDHVVLDFYVNPLHPRWKSGFCVDGREECAQYFVRDTPIPNTSSVLFRRAAYQEVGGADESLRICGDWKAWAAMALTGKMAYVSEPLNYYRTHNATIREAIWGRGATLNVRYVKERFEVTDWILERVKPSGAILEKAWAAHALHWVPQMTSLRISLRSKREILATVRRYDPQPLRRLLRTSCAAARDKTIWAIRNYVWHPVLNATRGVRHPLGIKRDHIRARFKRLA